MTSHPSQLPPLPPAFFAVVVALNFFWCVCTVPVVSFLRIVGLLSQPCFPQVDMTDKVCVITGANTGIGKRTAFHLAKMGGTVILACRSQDRASKARDDIIMELESGPMQVKSPNISIMLVDLSDTRSVRKFCQEFRSKFKRLDVLVNNAGINTTGTTTQGLNRTFASNFLGHFLLTTLLQDIIIRTPNARVINLSSVLHHYGNVKWITLREKSHYRPFIGQHARTAYSDSKMAMVLFSQELRRQFASSGSTATSFAVNPGAVFSDIWRSIPSYIKCVSDVVMKLTFLNVDEGSFTSVHAASAHLVELGGSGGCIYRQPYYLPFNFPHPFEYQGVFVGSAEGRVSLPKGHEKLGTSLWEQCQAIIAAAEK